MKSVIYTNEDKHRNAIITICLMKKYKTTARGIAICSKKDHPKGSTGAVKAEGRATKAIKRKGSCLPINRDEAIRLLFEMEVPPFRFKSEYNATLTEHEKELMLK